MSILFDYWYIFAFVLFYVIILITEFIQSLRVRTFCEDCGTETKPGSGSARCPSCWDDKCGHSSDA